MSDPPYHHMLSAVGDARTVSLFRNLECWNGGMGAKLLCVINSLLHNAVECIVLEVKECVEVKACVDKAESNAVAIITRWRKKLDSFPC
mmetsp:Transcript_1023/g.1686  ORF Transcript_1023/g.1686 Transcript_1023/m.1686 type:complete len:89 (+) Transcript_1023:997-1263(+)